MIHAIKQQQVPNGVENVEGRGPYIGTYLRGRFYPLDPRPEEMFIEDIARSLSMQCRYNGHIDRFYSVAEHSVIMSYMASTDDVAKWCLMHDATEAYIGDMVRPLKFLFPEFSEMEDKVHLVLAERFDLPYTMPDEVKKWDDVICSNEKEALISGGEHWTNMPPPHPTIKVPKTEFGPAAAEALFLMRYKELFKGEENG